MFGSDKFLVAHEEKGQTKALYTCMQIVKRSISVIQIKQATASKSLNGEELCSDKNMQLDGWLIIDTHSVINLNQRQDCSLVGGFNMQVYDRSTYTGVCDEHLGETRLESECLPGEGLNFYFRQAACVPDGLLMFHTQRTYCLANWDDEVFNFILLKHDSKDALWVLRYPKGVRRGNNFKALLMKDLFSSMEPTVSETNNYLILSMGNPVSKTLDNLCYDDYDICSAVKDPCSQSKEIAWACAKTCGFCSDTRPTVCHFSPAINGSWTDANRPEHNPYVQINATSMAITGSETLHCIDWSSTPHQPGSTANLRQMNSDHANKGAQKMLVTVSDNGCRPRFTCATLVKLPHVFFMQLSQTKLWPLVVSKDDPYNCSRFVYTTNKAADRNPYRKKLSTLFTPVTVAGVSCDLSRFGRFDVRFKGGTQCSGRLAQSASKSRLQFHLSNCPASILTQTQFTCVEYANFSASLSSNSGGGNNGGGSGEKDMLMITQTDTTTPKVHCWLFPEKPDNVFHMVASEDCNGAMKRKIRKGRLHPIATFTRDESFVMTESSTVQDELLTTVVEVAEIETTSSVETTTEITAKHATIIIDPKENTTQTASKTTNRELLKTTTITQLDTTKSSRFSTTVSSVGETTSDKRTTVPTPAIKSSTTTTTQPSSSQKPRTTKKPKATRKPKATKRPKTTKRPRPPKPTKVSKVAPTKPTPTKIGNRTTVKPGAVTEKPAKTNTVGTNSSGSKPALTEKDPVLVNKKSEGDLANSSLENKTQLAGNASAEYREKLTGPSPAVAAAIVLTFIAFQVSVICKCSC